MGPALPDSAVSWQPENHWCLSFLTKPATVKVERTQLCNSDYIIAKLKYIKYHILLMTRLDIFGHTQHTYPKCLAFFLNHRYPRNESPEEGSGFSVHRGRRTQRNFECALIEQSGYVLHWPWRVWEAEGSRVFGRGTQTASILQNSHHHRWNLDTQIKSYKKEST